MGMDDLLDDGNLKTLEIKPKKKNRSLDANAALWKLLHELAIKLKTSKKELYKIVLQRYGVFDHVVVVPEAVERLKKMSRFGAIEVKGEVFVNNKKSVHVLCYYGSSTYDSKEFAHLLDGVINEAKEQGIDFISKEEQIRMVEWRTNTSSVEKQDN